MKPVSAADLAQDFGNIAIPSGPKKGWLFVAFNKQGKITLLEPVTSAPAQAGRACMAEQHIIDLFEAGHEGARLWNPEDVEAIRQNIIAAGHNNIAQLNLGNDASTDSYWGQKLSRFDQKCDPSFYLKTGNMHWKGDLRVARIRTVQDITLSELKI